MKTWILVIALLTCLMAHFANGANVGENAECGGTTGDVCDATITNLNCVVEDCYKCRCASGYTYNSGTTSCDASGGAEMTSLSLITMLTSTLFAAVLSYA